MAVLYFTSRSADTTHAWLADGLTDEIIQRLTGLERVEVKSRTAVARLRGSQAAPDSLGRVLRATWLVSGAVQRDADRLRVTVELTRASTGVSAWAGTFDRRAADLLDIQATIADSVAQAIAGRLLPAERAALTRRPTRNAAAWDRYQRGSWALARRTGPDIRRAMRDFEAAIRLDSAFAGAWARLAFAWCLTLDHGWPGFGVANAIREGDAASHRALALDSTLADAWTARGYVLRFVHQRDYAGVREAFSRAIALAPRDAEAHHQFGWALEHLGDHTGALAALERAIALDPEMPIIRATMGWALMNARNYGRVIAQMDTAIQLDSNALRWAQRAWARFSLGDTARARADLVLLGDDVWEDALSSSLLAAMAARSGDSSQARAIAERLAAGLPARPEPLRLRAAWVAMAWAAVRDAGRAVELLERIEPRGLTIGWVTSHPAFDPIRGDERFVRYALAQSQAAAPR